MLKIKVMTKQIEDWLTDYDGKFEFLLSLKASLLTFGGLTPKQESALVKCYNRENVPGTPVAPEQITPPQATMTSGKEVNQIMYIKKWLAHRISEKLELDKLRSYAWQVTKILRETPKAYLVEAKIPDVEHNLGVCRNCGRKLTDEFSIATGMGSTCAKHWGVDYVKSMSEVDGFKKSLQARIDELGSFEFWLAKSQITEVEEIGVSS